MTLADLRAALGHPNVAAFLRVIREGETNQTDDAYRMMFGGELFDVTAGWQHPNKVNNAAGLSSTAAGAYQFLYRTWSGLVKQYGFPDFAPHCQDMGAVALIAGRGALQDVLDGRLDAAIAKCNREWASLPDSPYSQPVMTMARCRAVYEKYGGAYASAETAAPIEDKSTIFAEQETTPMMPAIVPSLLSALLTAVPDIARIFAGQSPTEAAKRNVALVEKVAQVVTQGAGASTLGEAVQKAAESPQIAAQVTQAIREDQTLSAFLVEAGGGGIGGARSFALQAKGEPGMVGTLRVVTYWVLGFLTFANVAGFALAGFLLYLDKGDWQQIVSALIQADIAAAFAAIGFWLGSSLAKGGTPTAAVRE